MARKIYSTTPCTCYRKLFSQDHKKAFSTLGITILLECALPSELNVDNWNDNCEAKSEAKSSRPLRSLQVDFSITHNVSYAVR